MNTSKIKQYAPKARNDFIAAITKKANQLGIYANKISEATEVGGALQIEGKSFDIAYKARRAQLIKSIEKNGFESVIEKVAYSWFNRLCAIRYMELHDYLDHGFRVLSHPNREDALEILDHAKVAADELGLKTDEVIDLQLAGNKEEELYRKLLLAQCHQLYKAMPFLFEAVNDETELLLPEGLTRTDSLIRELVTAIPEEDWEQVEIIGWLYQFYISEKKDEVIGKVVKSEDIPAATQLFTPNWIVKYLVQNSVGRQWLQTYPDSSIKDEMEYYIEPAEQTEEVNQQLKAITPESIDPEEIKVLDPACGSGHILVEAYSLLREIYIERGYKKKNFPKLILEKNIFGLDIDDRAAQLSGFALMMKAREDDRRIFTREVELNVVNIVASGQWSVVSEDQNHKVQYASILPPLTKGGGGGFNFSEDQNLNQIAQELIDLFKQADTFGSLIEIPEKIAKNLSELEKKVNEIIKTGDLFTRSDAELLIPIVKQAKILAQKYDAVIANPPYMGGKGMNAELKKFAKDNYPNSKSDLFSMFIEQCLNLSNSNKYCALITMQSWMFLSSYEKLRKKLISKTLFSTLTQIGYNSFPSLNSKIAQAVMFVLQNSLLEEYKGKFINLNEAPQSSDKNNVFLERSKSIEFEVVAKDFEKIKGAPIAYWVTKKVMDIYDNNKLLDDYADPLQGFATGNNDKFLRQWYEVDSSLIGVDCFDIGSVFEQGVKWIPCNKGGVYRRWYGNREIVVAFDQKHYQQLSNQGNNLPSRQYYFKKGWTWSTITSGLCSFRLSPVGTVFETKGSVCFAKEDEIYYQLGGYLNSVIVQSFLMAKSQTLDYHEGPLRTIPFINMVNFDNELIKKLVSLAKKDYDSFETSMGFSKLPIVNSSSNKAFIKDCYFDWKKSCSQDVDLMHNLEEKNNSIYINHFNLEGEVKPNVNINEISLTVNPKYRYGGNLSNQELTHRFQCDSQADLISYAVGCMMGRYSLDHDGLIYANSGNKSFPELEAEDLYSTYPADDDGIIPLTDLEWFDDDATYRFKEFLIAIWGEETLQENLQFVAESLTLYAIKPKKDESSLETIRRYLSTGFYKQHLKTYKKRPIYWLFSSGKQKAFEALVYLHRYNESTLARMRTEYVTPLMGKYEARADSMQQQLNTTSGTDARRIEKELKALNNKQTELRTFDDKLKHHADMRISIDLDDGVKVNYGKFGDLLAEVKAVTGKKPE